MTDYPSRGVGMTEQTDAAQVLSAAICPCAGDGDGQHIPELDQECAWSLSLARAVLASDWLAAREAAAEVRGAQAVLAAVEGEVVSLRRPLNGLRQRANSGADFAEIAEIERVQRDAAGRVLRAARAAAAAASGGGEA